MPFRFNCLLLWHFLSWVQGSHPLTYNTFACILTDFTFLWWWGIIIVLNKDSSQSFSRFSSMLWPVISCHWYVIYLFCFKCPISWSCCWQRIDMLLLMILCKQQLQLIMTFTSPHRNEEMSFYSSCNCVCVAFTEQGNQPFQCNDSLNRLCGSLSAWEWECFKRKEVEK